jgi:hypothetical protein
MLGSARQGAPILAIQKTALKKALVSAVCRPLSPAFPGNLSLMSFHSPSVIS